MKVKQKAELERLLKNLQEQLESVVKDNAVLEASIENKQLVADCLSEEVLDLESQVRALEEKKRDQEIHNKILMRFGPN